MAQRPPDCVSPLQQAIAECVARNNELTKYKLAKQSGIQPGHIYYMFRRPVLNWHIERMLAALGARITIGQSEFQFVLQPNYEDGEGKPWFVLQDVDTGRIIEPLTTNGG